MTGIYLATLKNDLITGTILVVFSFVPYLDKNMISNGVLALIFTGCFFLGISLVANHVTRKLGGVSLLNLIHKRRFIVTAILFGTIFQFVVADLGGLWFYPWWSPKSYFVIGYLLGGWAFYSMSLVVCYEAAKLAFDKFIPKHKIISRYYKWEPLLYRSFLVIGLVAIVLSIAQILNATDLFTNFTYIINHPKVPYISWQTVLIFFVGLYLILGYIDFKHSKSSIIKDTIHGYFSPTLSLIFMGLPVAILCELQNEVTHLWGYANYPLGTFLNLPISLTWGWAISVAAIIMFWSVVDGCGRESRVLLSSGKRTKRQRAHQRVLAN